MANISPGVYTKIIDLSTFVQAVPATIGLACGLTKKGRDNELTFVGSRADFVSEWGEPDITAYSKSYGQGPYITYNHLGESGSFYWMRCLPDDAQYANLRIDTQNVYVDATSDTTALIILTSIDSVNSLVELRTNLAPIGTLEPIGFLYPIGRGDAYNDIGIRFTAFSNPLFFDTYVMDVYEKQSDGDDIIIESFNVSFEPTAKDNAGESLWIQSILETYSSILRFEMYTVPTTETLTKGYEQAVKHYDREIGETSVTLTAASASIQDIKQDFSDWETSAETGLASYMVVVKDDRGNELTGWLGAATGTNNEAVNIYDAQNLNIASRGWIGTTASFDAANSTNISYRVKETNPDISDAFISATPVPLRKGSDGSLISSSGVLDTDEATTLLVQGYSGLLTNPKTNALEDTILDPESLYFTIVYDAGYPSDVKTAISTLCQTRRDCVGILDNGDNATVNASLSSRSDTHVFNNYFVSIYESYNKVFDPFTGQDVWFSPLYHMSYIIPRNDTVAEIWFAPAGFNRAAIDSIKELRFNPRLGQRDQMYLRQLNPIVRFAQGYTTWSQLTSQAKASALQDLNIVRMILFVKRALEQYCRFFIFEQNDAVTWGEVSGDITEFLEVIKQRRGLDAYDVEVGATDYERKTKTFHVNVTLTPTRIVEKIELNFFIL